MNSLALSFGNLSLLKRLVAREISERFRGSYLGWLWLVLAPLLMLVVFTFVFSVVFQSRWGDGAGTSRVEFALRLFTGLSVFTFFSECVSRAPDLIRGKKNYVKEVVFPLQILPVVTALSSLLGLVISILLLILVAWITGYSPHVALILTPLVLLPLFLLVLGLVWFLSALGVYLRDTSQVVLPLVQMMMFLSPVFYPLSALPQQFHGIVMINPLVFPIEALRSVLFSGTALPAGSLAVYWLVSITVALLGYLWFQATRRGFADVL